MSPPRRSVHLFEVIVVLFALGLLAGAGVMTASAARGGAAEQVALLELRAAAERTTVLAAGRPPVTLAGVDGAVLVYTTQDFDAAAGTVVARAAGTGPTAATTWYLRPVVDTGATVDGYCETAPGSRHSPMYGCVDRLVTAPPHLPAWTGGMVAAAMLTPGGDRCVITAVVPGVVADRIIDVTDPSECSAAIAATDPHLTARVAR